jgi:hypothetical protein
VREGITVTLSWPLNTTAAADNPRPADHHMTAWGGDDPISLAKDYVGVDYHSDTHTHIDALSHVGYEGSLYNGKPADAVTSRGATAESIEVLKGASCSTFLDSEGSRGSSLGSTSFAMSWRQPRPSRGCPSGKGTSCWSEPATPVDSASWAPGTPPSPSRGYTRGR